MNEPTEDAKPVGDFIKNLAKKHTAAELAGKPKPEPCEKCGELLVYVKKFSGEGWIRCGCDNCDAIAIKNREKLKSLEATDATEKKLAALSTHEGQTKARIPWDFHGAELKDFAFLSDMQKRFVDFVGESFDLDKTRPGILYLYGEHGIGKSHALWAMYRECLKLGFPARAFDMHMLLKKLQGMCGQDPQREYEYLTALGYSKQFLFLDELSEHNSTEFTLSDIVLLISIREREHLPTVITSNLDQAALGEYLDSRIATRLQRNIVGMKGRDRRAEKKPGKSEKRN